MPKYYCDVCDCSFPDNVTNRKNHEKGQVHINNKRRHYDWFKEPNEFISEQLNKRPCKRYHTLGHCEFGLDCRFGHIKTDQRTGQFLFPTELLEWLDAKSKETSESALQKQQQQQQRRKRKRKRKSPNDVYRLPSGWKVNELPPSLRPPPWEQPKDGHHHHQLGVWG